MTGMQSLHPRPYHGRGCTRVAPDPVQLSSFIGRIAKAKNFALILSDRDALWSADHDSSYNSDEIDTLMIERSDNCYAVEANMLGKPSP